MPPAGRGRTVFALASGIGRAAIAVMRLSGPDVAAILVGLAGPLPEPRRATLRRLRHGGRVLDEALVLWFPAPRSYTGEPAAELHLHGGPAVVAAVAAALTERGARPAEPGEFTRRALAHGKLDLLAAEGIADLIDAETEAQRVQAQRQAAGGLSALVQGWSARLLALLARQEAFIEFETEDLPADLDAAVVAAAGALREEIAAHIGSSASAERLRRGVSIAIIGAPNAGKSTLLNALVGRDAAIVSSIAGTTRDVVEARVVLAGVPVTFSDTAGLRVAIDPVEAEGVRRARTAAADADVVLVVFAADATPDAATRGAMDDRALPVLTKIDLDDARGCDIPGLFPVSALTGAGFEALRQAIVVRVAAQVAVAGPAFTRERHRAALAEAVEWLDHLPAAPLPELRAEALRAAVDAIGRLTGRIDVDAVLDEVFAAFCIGK